MKFFYDQKGDVLYISIGSPKKAISKEVEDDILIRVDPKTEEVVGFTILNFIERFSDERKERTVPVKAQFHIINEQNSKPLITLRN